MDDNELASMALCHRHPSVYQILNAGILQMRDITKFLGVLLAFSSMAIKSAAQSRLNQQLPGDRQVSGLTCPTRPPDGHFEHANASAICRGPTIEQHRIRHLMHAAR